MSPFNHQTVLKGEVVRCFEPGVQRVIVDGTLGGGGHSEALLEAGFRVVGVDRDPVALAAATSRLARFGEAFRAVQGEFGAVASLVPGPVDGLVLDLGVSSPQLDTPERGFSFMHDGPLDMRMSGEGETAAELIARLPERELADVIYQYGEERSSRPIARALKARLPKTTFEAVEAVKQGVPRRAWPKETHVATRTFQALRIAVNAELEQLERALASLPGWLGPRGVAAIISFHSLEDRLVKQAFKKWCGEQDDAPKGLPVARTTAPTFEALTRKPVVAADEEITRNPRARSAKLRAVRKLPGVVS
ncbi:MAG: 16S rRNA (cytosine(1402)-N(4))-methyltransferase RsmH [Myxococcaceae bacterium]|nr:16S rRNA (cytosine(1402)-N(4))-methyltransferase RsmH [Myxococcaceae bacterium]